MIDAAVTFWLLPSAWPLRGDPHLLPRVAQAIMFVNMQGDGLTFAIKGPWRRGRY